MVWVPSVFLGVTVLVATGGPRLSGCREEEGGFGYLGYYQKSIFCPYNDETLVVF